MTIMLDIQRCGAPFSFIMIPATGLQITLVARVIATGYVR